MKKKLILIFICIIWGLVIFSFSNKDSQTSNEVSKNLIYKVLAPITNIINVSENEIPDIIESLNKPVRKIAHMTEYFILALLVFNIINTSKLKTKKYILTLIVCFCYALFDEYHQTFVNGRTGQLIDCFIDSLGSILYLLLVYTSSKKEH